MSCKYIEALGCTECDYVHFILCPRFKEAHVRACAKSLGCFRYEGVSSGVTPVGVHYGHYPQAGVKDVKALYAKKEYKALSSRLKSMALWSALHRYSGYPVIYMSMDTIVEVCFAYGRGVYEFERGVYFLEVWESGLEQQKAVSFLNSVISKIQNVGGEVYLLSSWVLPVLGLTWERVVVAGAKKSGRSVRKVTSSVGGSKVADSYMQEEEVL